MKKFFKYFFLVIAGLIALVIINFLLVRKMDKDRIAEKLPTPAFNARPMLLPGLFLEGERFYLKMTATNGDTLLAYCDSGGGISMILEEVAKKLGVSNKIKTGLLKGVMPMKYIAFADVIDPGGMPAPVLPRHLVPRRPYSPVEEPFLMVAPDDKEMRDAKQLMRFDIFLGQNYFMGKAWTIDYPKRQIWVHTPIDAREADSVNVLHLGFKKNEAGDKIFGHPSMVIEVDGEIIEVLFDTIEVLFDTGATIILSEQGGKELNTNEKTIGGSFIATSVFDKWHKQHPDWKVYTGADKGRDIIEVPKVKIAGSEVGPVLFAVRPDEVWSEGMIHSMDKVVRGAIGGSALKYLKVTIDYNSELAKFE